MINLIHNIYLFCHFGLDFLFLDHFSTQLSIFSQFVFFWMKNSSNYLNSSDNDMVSQIAVCVCFVKIQNNIKFHCFLKHSFKKKLTTMKYM